MNRGTVPPQAYTRDQVTAAYQWLQTQSDDIRRQATTTDTLVALYLRAKRSGDLSFVEAAPVSEKNFRENLRTIASELQNFDPQPPSVLSSTSMVVDHGPSNQMTQTASMGGPAIFGSPAPTIQRFSGTHPGHMNNGSTKVQNLEIKEVVQSSTTTTLTTATSDGLDIDLDPISWGRLTEIKQRLNLSHEREALRMLLVLGYEKLQRMLSD